MFKLIATLASAALLSVVTITTAANAGCGGGHGFHAQKSYASPSRAAQLKVKKAAQARALAAAKRKQQSKIAKVETAPVVADSQAPTAELAKADVTVAAVEDTCTKFIAATGTTVAVECSKE